MYVVPPKLTLSLKKALNLTLCFKHFTQSLQTHFSLTCKDNDCQIIKTNNKLRNYINR